MRERLYHLRLRLGVWLLKPHWVPLLEHYSAQAQSTYDLPEGAVGREHCAYIAIGIKRAVGFNGRSFGDWWHW